MRYYRFTRRRCLRIVAVLFIVECSLNLLYHGNMNTVSQIQIKHQSSESEVKSKTEDRFQQLMKFCAKIIVRSPAQDDAASRKILPTQHTVLDHILYSLKNSNFNSEQGVSEAASEP